VAILAAEIKMSVAGHSVFSDDIAHIKIRPNRGRGTRSPFSFG
jgi:hypothetical protein